MSYRLWFRLADVLPLAEHAMSCTTHRTTSAQSLAQAPPGPALIWTGNPIMDLLTSGGMPAWYSEGGTIHAAEAHTWRYINARRYGIARVDGYDTAYLPLDVTRSQLSVIDVLRDVRRTNRHWVTVDIDPADRHLIPPGRVRAVDHRDQLVPNGAEWVPATVTSSAVGGTGYPALVADDYHNNAGFELPRFDRPTIERMIADLDAMPADATPDRRAHLHLGGVLRIMECGRVRHGASRASR
ncbi:hypothetical protein ACN27G_29075 [Plantactinospora sp. WMMB334]|uniref:hypothetical protein n=1 Tax=Plantactinospora sp. WMMB334 TaxID=3404119 RepID=UPI003B93FC17